MAVDIKRVLRGLKERKETMLVWGLGAVALCLGAFLLIGYIRGISPPPPEEVVVKRKEPLKSKEEIIEEAITKLKEARKIPPFIEYQDILTKNLFLQSRMARIVGEEIVEVGGFVLKGIWKEAEKVVAFIQDPGGRAYPVRVGQMIGTSEVKVVAIDYEKQSATLMSKSWAKPQVIRLARETLEEKGMILFRPSEKKEPEKPVTEEEARKAIAEAKKRLSDASEAILTARSEGVDTDEAEARRDDAKIKLEDAQEAIREKDYKRAKELAKSAQALAQEAKRLVSKAEEEEEEEEIGKGEREED